MIIGGRIVSADIRIIAHDHHNQPHHPHDYRNDRDHKDDHHHRHLDGRIEREHSSPPVSPQTL